MNEYNNKELNSNVKKGKVNEESDLRKPFRKNKNEEKDNKQLNASENIKMISELYKKYHIKNLRKIIKTS